MPKNLANAPKPPEPPLRPTRTTRVILTPPQREAVREHTGRDYEYIDVADDDGSFARDMPRRSPDEITLVAMRYADRDAAWEAQQAAYLAELAAWQDAPEDEPIDAAQAAAQVDVEERQKAIAEYYAQEAKALAAAREEAKKAFDPKGKKAAKAAKAEAED